ncbi:MAG: bifunctional diaminohydroxyphosphoribosylaminopyrimidine deaminase/5-amino-6-(5-phosphoribosylamino)uracil reductase RibD [Maribacter sp.]
MSYFYRVKIMEKYISRCMQLAKNGLGSTFPNPMVGSVIVHNNNIIGEGYTSAFGGPHAEVNAINSVQDKSLLSGATIYVTLEPCSHYGKTPPCADLIVKNRIPNVVIGTLDPNKKVAGQGLKRLKAAGCNVTIGVLEEKCKEHHKRFLTYHQKKRPYIILKWAESNDGFIAPQQVQRIEKPQPYWISNSYSRQLVHKWRSEEQAILIGTNTILTDNPKLNVRDWFGKPPIRIVLDKELKIKGNYHILDKSVKTIIITQVDDKNKWETGIEYEVIDFAKNLAFQICKILHSQHLISVLVEGGAQTLQTFLDADLWDETRIFKGPTPLGNGLKAPVFKMKIISSKKIGADSLNIYLND